MSKKPRVDYDYEAERMNLSKEEKKYLNSKARMVKAIIWDILEYILMFVLVFILMSYIENGNLDHIEESLSQIQYWLQPGGMLFNALVGFLPVILVSSIGRYFGIGTYGRMLFGIAKCGAVILWFYLLAAGATTSLELPEVFENMGLDGLTIGLEGLKKFITLLMLCCMLIPVGEFCGARKKHRRAAAKLKSIEEEKAREAVAE